MLNELLPGQSENQSQVWLKVLEGLGNPINREASRLIQDIDTVEKSRLSFRKGITRINPYSEEIIDLVNDPERVGRFKSELKDYEDKWAKIKYTSKGLTQRERVISILKQHPYVKKGGNIYAIPLAVMMDIANQSDVGIYSQGKPVLTSLENFFDTAFATLAFNKYWREMMGKHAIRMAERFSRQGKKMDLVMVGDGSGDLGASMAQVLLTSDFDFRLVHMDISDGMLTQQKNTYLQAGIPEDKIIGIKGSVIKDAGKIKQTIPDFEGGFFILHELLDSLRTHTIVSDYYGITELYQVTDLAGTRDLEAFETTHPLIQHAGQYLPFYNPVKGQTRLIPFSPQGIICMREILEKCDEVAMYIGDYGGQFVIGEKTEAVYKGLPVRVYGEGVKDKDDYSLLFKQPVDMTADVLPTIVHFSSIYGGQVEQLTTQEEYLAIVDPSLPKKIVSEMERIRQKSQSGGYKAGDERQLLQDSLFVKEICNPCFFAAQITKGI